MGIQALARTAFRASLATFKATGPNRNQLRRFVAVLTDAGNEWLAKHDAQDVSATVTFAESKPAQYQAHLATLPEVTLAPDPTEDP